MKECIPAGTGRQAVDPPGEYEPAGHCTQAEATSPYPAEQEPVMAQTVALSCQLVVAVSAGQK